MDHKRCGCGAWRILNIAGRDCGCARYNCPTNIERRKKIAAEIEEAKKTGEYQEWLDYFWGQEPCN